MLPSPLFYRRPRHASLLNRTALRAPSAPLALSSWWDRSADRNYLNPKDFQKPRHPMPSAPTLPTFLFPFPLQQQSTSRASPIPIFYVAVRTTPVHIQHLVKLPLLSAPALVRFLRNVDAARLPPTIRTLNRLWIPTHSIPAGVLLSYGSHLLQCRISHATLLPPSPRRPQTSRGRMTSTVRELSTFPSSAAAFPTHSNVRAASTQQSPLRVPRR
ncbi:hypothetical protein B0H19DRAFT_1273593 [Mycena capillaripes]|nr:hypothetical protein B0H19DRAFT_1273593 [Mycena capillaripes]